MYTSNLLSDRIGCVIHSIICMNFTDTPHACSIRGHYVKAELCATVVMICAAISLFLSAGNCTMAGFVVPTAVYIVCSLSGRWRGRAKNANENNCWFPRSSTRDARPTARQLKKVLCAFIIPQIRPCSC